MWKYRRRLSIRPMQTAITFAGSRLIIAADGRVLSPVSDELAMKMKKAPHSFIFDVSLKAEPVEMVAAAPLAQEPAPEPEAVEPEPEMAEDESADEQKVETSSDKDDNTPKRKRRSRKSAEG
jgi:hypothetical protein